MFWQKRNTTFYHVLSILQPVKKQTCYFEPTKLRWRQQKHCNLLYCVLPGFLPSGSAAPAVQWFLHTSLWNPAWSLFQDFQAFIFQYFSLAFCGSHNSKTSQISKHRSEGELARHNPKHWIIVSNRKRATSFRRASGIACSLAWPIIGPRWAQKNAPNIGYRPPKEYKSHLRWTAYGLNMALTWPLPNRPVTCFTGGTL